MTGMFKNANLRNKSTESNVIYAQENMYSSISNLEYSRISQSKVPN